MSIRWLGRALALIGFMMIIQSLIWMSHAMWTNRPPGNSEHGLNGLERSASTPSSGPTPTLPPAGRMPGPHIPQGLLAIQMVAARRGQGERVGDRRVVGIREHIIQRTSDVHVHPAQSIDDGPHSLEIHQGVAVSGQPQIVAKRILKQAIAPARVTGQLPIDIGGVGLVETPARDIGP